MKIATFLLRRGEVVPFANDAKFIELTKAYDAAYAAEKKIALETAPTEDDPLKMIKLLSAGPSEELLTLSALKGELSRFLAHAAFEVDRRIKAEEERRNAKAKLDDEDASEEDTDVTTEALDDDVHNEGNIYDYDPKDSFYSSETIKKNWGVDTGNVGYSDMTELVMRSRIYEEDMDAYHEVNIFDLAEDDKSYAKQLEIYNSRDRYENDGDYNPPSSDDPMSEDEKEVFFGED